jgi:superfamily II DNA or RNA helicase
MLKLSPIQQTIIDDNRLKTIIGLGTGKGKTLTSLLLAQGRILIVVDKQQKVDRTFEETITKFNLVKDITILTIDQFRKTWDTLPYFDTLIIDECHKQLGGAVVYFRFKTYFKPSSICKALLSYVKKHNPQRVYPLTATIEASPMTIYNACKIIGVNYNLEDWIKAFYFLLNERYRVKKDENTEDRLIAVVSKNGYYEKHDDAPEQIFEQIYVENTPEQNKRIDEIKVEYQDIQQVSKIYQIENGVLKGNQFQESEIFPCLKYDIIKDIAKRHKRLIIFATFTEQINRIYDTLYNDFLCYKLTGQTRKVDRETVLTELNQRDEYILIVNTAINSGWELPKCPTMCFFSVPYSTRPHQRIQAEGRIQRHGNLKVNTYIDIITKGGVNEALYHAQKNGKKFSEKLYFNQHNK